MTRSHRAVTVGFLAAVLFSVFSPSPAQASQWTDWNTEVISLYRQGRYQEAISLAEQALALAKASGIARDPYVATSYNNLGALYQSVGRDAEAERLYRQALEIDLELFGEGHPRGQIDRANLAGLSAVSLLPATRGESQKQPDTQQDSADRWKWNWDYWNSVHLVPPGEGPPRSAARAAEEDGRTPSPGFLGWNGEFSTRGGYRFDRLDWSIAGDLSGKNPNVLSELTWDDLESYTFSADGWLIRPSWVAFKGSFDYGWILNGDNRDSDYLGNNRTFEFSRSNNTSDDGYLFDVSGAIGYPWQPAPGDSQEIRIIPMVGYSYHRQHLTITDGFQTIPATGSFADLNSRYVTRWAGPWLGLDLAFKPYKKIRVHAGVEYHWASYLANARWNLRTDFSQPKSFRHIADGNGIVTKAGLEYELSNRWGIHLEGNFQDWSTDPGIDRTFFSSGTTSETRLNEVNWESWSVSLGAKYSF